MSRIRIVVPLVVVLAATVLPANAFAATRDHVLAGQVTDGLSGNRLEGICVAVQTVPGATPARAYSGQTNAVGAYKFLLPDGTYLVSFTDCGSNPVYLTQRWNDAPNAAGATPLTMGGTDAAAQARPGINAKMTAGAIVTGVVTGRTDGAPIQGICVRALRGIHVPAIQTTTDGSGHYRLPLPNDTYQLLFNDCRSTPAYLDQSRDLTVDGYTQHELTEDAALELGGTITGQVTDENTGLPIAGICVSDASYTSAHTGLDGTYTIPDLPTGNTYILMFSECPFDGVVPHPYYATEFFDHSATMQTATRVAVQAPNTTVADEPLVEAGTITGTVTDAQTGLPLSGITVNAASPDTATSSGAETGADGTFTLIGLAPAGTYRVEFSDLRNGLYATQWWDAQPSAATANYVSIVSGATTSGIDAAMQPA
ncbi:MAG: hypothetical protein QOF18_586 [Frankiaceae bacterium]|nr:hypothetical protein [Frankiaceae bacterium]